MKMLHVISYSLLRFKDACTQRSNDLVDLTVVAAAAGGGETVGQKKRKKRLRVNGRPFIQSKEFLQ